MVPDEDGGEVNNDGTTRDVQTTPVSVTLNAILTQTALAPRSAGLGNAGSDWRDQIVQFCQCILLQRYLPK